jgi:hypothetical protein
MENSDQKLFLTAVRDLDFTGKKSIQPADVINYLLHMYCTNTDTDTGTAHELSVVDEGVCDGYEEKLSFEDVSNTRRRRHSSMKSMEIDFNTQEFALLFADMMDEDEDDVVAPEVQQTQPLLPILNHNCSFTGNITTLDIVADGGEMQVSSLVNMALPSLHELPFGRGNSGSHSYSYSQNQRIRQRSGSGSVSKLKLTLAADELGQEIQKFKDSPSADKKMSEFQFRSLMRCGSEHDDIDYNVDQLIGQLKRRDSGTIPLLSISAFQLPMPISPPHIK